MARLSNASSLTLTGHGNPFDQSSAELGQLLLRLQQTVLHPDPERERRLRTNEYERARLASNLEYARNTLTKLEQDALSVLAPGRRAELQANLNGKRELLELLMDRLQDLHKIALDDEDSSEGEDILGDVIPTPSESQESTSIDYQQDTPEPTIPEPQKQTQDPPETPIQDLPTQTTQTLRVRSSVPPLQQPSHTTARAQLFASRRLPPSKDPQNSTATAEAILDQQAAEREELADKVFRMAQAMKKQQQSIHDSLESEKDVLGKATEGMERTGRGMEVAKGRMGALQRMTEGKGWWGRIILYAWVYGLMLGLAILVFVMPKLRF